MYFNFLSKKLYVGTAMTAMVIASTMSATAQNKQTINLPIIQTKYTADPAPYVHATQSISTPLTMRMMPRASR